MAETPVQNAEPPQRLRRGRPGDRPSWRALIPIAALAVGLLLLVAGVVARYFQQAPGNTAKPLAEARALLEEHKHEEALALLNGPGLKAAETGGVEARAELFRLRARAISEGQQAGGQNFDANNEAIVRDYVNAEKLGAALTPVEVYQLARAHLALGDMDDAVGRVRALPASEADLRRRLVMQIIEHEIAAGTMASPSRRGGPSAGLALLDEMLGQRAISPDDRAWAVARQAELQIAAGNPRGAQDRLLREVPQAAAASGERKAELHAVLARAYLAEGNLARAREHLDTAAGLADRLGPLRAEIGVLMGNLHEREPADLDGSSGLVAARERYRQVLEEYPNSVHAAAARFGLARVESALAQEHDSGGAGDREAARLFAEVLDDARSGRAGPAVTKQAVRDALMTAAQRSLDRGRTEAAVDYATHAESLDPEGKVPAEVLLLKAQACRRLAEERLAAARSAAAGPSWLEETDPVTREEIKTNFLNAARAFSAHAVLARGGESADFVSSLWAAADCADLAGDAEAAKRAFRDYIEQAPDTDQRRSEARWRLARVFQAERQFLSAAALYRTLVDARLRAGGASGSEAPGSAAADPWGDKSIVPLAQCLLRDDDQTNDAEAEDLLRAAVGGRTLSSRAIEFRDALVELGHLRYTRGRYGGADGAIALLRQAADRYPDDPDADAILYMLADSYRLSAAEMGREIEQEAMPQSEKEARRSERRDRLAAAMDLFARVRRDLESRDPAALTALERIHLRNACFYLGDVAFDLGDYDPTEYNRAIEYYEAARQRYADDPACLVALVQIASAYVALGRFDEARAANARARQQLDDLPPNVWNDPTLPMERRHWERWLDASAELDRRAAVGPQ